MTSDKTIASTTTRPPTALYSSTVIDIRKSNHCHEPTAKQAIAETPRKSHDKHGRSSLTQAPRQLQRHRLPPQHGLAHASQSNNHGRTLWHACPRQHIRLRIRAMHGRAESDFWNHLCYFRAAPGPAGCSNNGNIAGS